MEGLKDISNKKKRARDDSDLNSAESKRVGDELDNSDMNSPYAKRFRYDFLDILDDSDTVTDRDSAIQRLDSVIKSFEEEILVPTPPASVLDVTSDSGGSQPELGYLLEASDDELGLPPTFSSPDEGRSEAETVDFTAISSETVGLGEILGFEDEIPSYDSFGFGIVDELNGNNNGEFVTLGGLFDYSDVTYESSDYSEFTWRPESMRAL